MRFDSFDAIPLFAYGMVFLDPPWRFNPWGPGGFEKAPDRHYETMPIDQIAEFPIGHVVGRDGVVCMMATHPMIDQQIELGRRAWGLRFVTSGVWVKRTKHGKLGFGTGYRLRSASEPFLIFVNGDPSTAKDVRTVIEGPLREHSRKPDEMYREMERLAGDVRRIDLFSRQDRAGWDAWGREAGKFNGEEDGTGRATIDVDRAEQTASAQPPSGARAAGTDNDAQHDLF